ncbi:hypothetical protein F5I97DRAFT_1889378 [Phlebopus sp. FC_14]|nr:hypothetical protein F5I97DRAFT_1889378 [Phlebopus sp. FC_14]
MKRTTGIEEAEDPQSESDIPWPGTFVEVRRGLNVTTGIIVGNALIENRTYAITLTLTGDVISHNVSDIFFEIPRMVSRDLALRAGIHTEPNTRTEANARVGILKQLRDIERQVVNALVTIGSYNVDVYPLVTARDPEEWSSVTLSQATKLITNQRNSSFPYLLATHRHLMKRTSEFVPHISLHRSMQTFGVRPQSHVKKLCAVRDMIHQSSPAVDRFAEKARRIIATNKQRMVESWNEPPTQTFATDVDYTAEDRLIADVLQHALRRMREVSIDPYSLVVTTVLKKIDAAIPHVDLNILHRILVDLGHLAPWDDLVSRRQELALDQRADEESSKVIAQNNVMKRNLAKTASAQSDTPLGPEDFYPRDLAEHIRHDFGDLPVYVVDDAGAEELDDGLSIEPIPSQPGAVWIHVHIADPTSIIPPTHVFAQQARQMGFSAYFTHRTWPMLPTSLVHTKLSLGASSKLGEPEPVLTFSFKLDPTGNLAGYKVRAGLVRNITTLDYDSMDKLLGLTKEGLINRPFDRHNSVPAVHAPTLDSKHLENLRIMTDSISRHRLRNMETSGSFTSALAKAKTSISPKPLVGTSLHNPHPFHFRGFPHLTYEVASQDIYCSGARMVVSECMKLACRVASRWTLDNGVPMLRRASRAPICLGDPHAVEKLLEIRDADGFVDFYAVRSANLFVPPVEHTLEPAMHWSMGIPTGEGYIRVTSPLRRYNDLVAHWQIKDALLHPGSNSPLFSRAWLTEYAPEISDKERMTKKAENHHFEYWSHVYLKRFMEDPHPTKDRHNPLVPLTAMVSGTRPSDSPFVDSAMGCHIPSLGIFASLSIPAGVQLTVGSPVNVDITQIQTGLRPRVYVNLKQ